jgi:hypothetical protein
MAWEVGYVRCVNDETASKTRRSTKRQVIPSEAYRASPVKLVKLMKRRRRLRAADDAAWERACNEIAASILADEVQRFLDVRHEPELVLRGIRARIESAQIEIGEHPIGSVDCLCRHDALIAVGALEMKRQTGVYPTNYCDSMRALLNVYLARRS